MVIDEDDDLSGFTSRQLPAAGLTYDYLESVGGDEPVILLHELPAITPQVMHLARVIGQAGFKVLVPSFMGRPGRVPNAWDQAASGFRCLKHPFSALARGDQTRPAVNWVRALTQAAAQGRHGRVGVIGLCLTGGFALAAAIEPGVGVAVACEPSLPFKQDDAIDLDPAHQATLRARLEADTLAAVIYRFEGDRLSPCVRLQRYGAALGPQMKSRCLPNEAADPAYRGGYPHHSVMTNHLVEAPGSLTQAARDEMIAVLAWRLRGGPRPASWTSASDCLAGGCAAKRASTMAGAA